MKGAFGCLRSCLLVVAVILAVIAAMNYLLKVGDASGMETALVVAAVLIVVAIVFFGHHSHWTS